MIKGTRFFSRRLLPLLLAAVMLLGMLPALTLPVLAEDPPALTNVAQGKNVSIHGPTSGADRPASWLTDGITDSGKYVEISKDTEQNSTAQIQATRRSISVRPMILQRWSFGTTGMMDARSSDL